MTTPAVPPSPPQTRRESHPPQWREWMLAHNFARAHLSSERTFLGWVRTSLSFITLGFVVQRFNLLLDPRQAQRLAAGGLLEWVPATFFVLGAAIIVLGAVEYFGNRRRIESGATIIFPRLRDTLVVSALIFLLLVIGIFLISKP